MSYQNRQFPAESYVYSAIIIITVVSDTPPPFSSQLAARSAQVVFISGAIWQWAPTSNVVRWTAALDSVWLRCTALDLGCGYDASLADAYRPKGGFFLIYIHKHTCRLLSSLFLLLLSPWCSILTPESSLSKLSLIILLRIVGFFPFFLLLPPHFRAGSLFALASPLVFVALPFSFFFFSFGPCLASLPSFVLSFVPSLGTWVYTECPTLTLPLVSTAVESWMLIRLFIPYDSTYCEDEIPQSPPLPTLSPLCLPLHRLCHTPSSLRCSGTQWPQSENGP